MRGIDSLCHSASFMASSTKSGTQPKHRAVWRQSVDGSARWEATLLFALRLAGVLGLCTGGFGLGLAIYVPVYRAKLEQLGGGLLVGGLALLGFAFAMV